ncbi:hypothetical protein CJ204_09410 [Corynebacterium xerosis]|uniref:Uncharacterized protein n=1 Tax=Corynebacterium xerosis TaxID=1725 RepID=A0A2N6SXB0_9CORY|nr:hypothetical protein CJ204_09410 [Corynebacterium xerosis]
MLLVVEDVELDVLVELDAVELVCSPSFDSSVPQPTSRSAAMGTATIRATVFMTQLWQSPRISARPPFEHLGRLPLPFPLDRCRHTGHGLLA